MQTVLVVGLAILGLLAAVALGLVAMFNRRVRRAGALAAHDATTRWSASVAPAQISGASVDGRRLWQSTAAIQVEPGSIAGGVLYGASVQNGLNTQLAALDVANGRQLWQVAATSLGTASNVSNLLLLGSVVLVGDM